MGSDFYRSPAYQEYAANLLASDAYFNLTLEQSGLFHRIRLLCWCNQKVSSDASILARRIGFESSDVARILPTISHLFDTSEGWISSPELEIYREHLRLKSCAKSKAGKASGAVRSGKKSLNTCSTDVDRPLNTLNVNQTKPNQTHAVNGEPITTLSSHSDWLKEYGDV